MNTNPLPDTLDKVRAIAFGIDSIFNNELVESVIIQATWGSCRVYRDGTIEDAR